MVHKLKERMMLPKWVQGVNSYPPIHQNKPLTSIKKKMDEHFDTLFMDQVLYWDSQSLVVTVEGFDVRDWETNV